VTARRHRAGNVGITTLLALLSQSIPGGAESSSSMISPASLILQYSPRKVKTQIASIFMNATISNSSQQSVERYAQRGFASGNTVMLEALDFGLWNLEQDLGSYPPRVMSELLFPKSLRSINRWKSKRVRIGGATTSIGLAAQNPYAPLGHLPFPERPLVYSYSPSKVKSKFLAFS
jgi:hypothetical protein